jgi:glycosyltransferase involved in cell wall biosynthesis
LLTAIILTFDSEQTIKTVVDSCRPVAHRILVVDSFSKDRTVELARELGCEVIQHSFENYSAQRNWAQTHAALKDDDWVLHLDSDEALSSELQASVREALVDPQGADGFLVRRQTFFMGKPIRYGHTNPSWHLRLFRASKGRCEDRLYDQHFLTDGPARQLAGILFDYQKISLERWTQTHNRWSTLEAQELLQDMRSAGGDTLRADLHGDPRMRKRWYKNRLYYRSPPLLRAFGLFFYCYIIRMGFLDGRTGFIYHVLQAFWFRFLVDAKLEQALLEDAAAPHADSHLRT